MERVRRVELPTLCLASIRSSQLSYTRSKIFLPEAVYFVNFLDVYRFTAFRSNAAQARLPQTEKLHVIIDP
jgi:hypothetical protein